MNEWGYVISDKTGNVLAIDFGYETEEDAEKYGKNRRNKFREKTRMIVEQRGRDVDESGDKGML